MNSLRFDAHEDSVWVCIVLPDDVAKAIEPLMVGEEEEREGGVGPHITLVYLGKRSNFTDEQLARGREAVRAVAAQRAPLQFRFTGAGKFTASKQSDRKTPVYLVPSAPGLASLRTDLLRALKDAGLQKDSPFDFSPHVCIGYVDDPETPVPSEVPQVTWTSDEISFMENPECEEMQLAGSRADRAVETPYEAMNEGDDVASPIPFLGGLRHGMPKKSHRAGDAPMPFKLDIISKKGGGFVLKSHEGKVLGEHSTEAEAKSQEAAINISKARAAGHHIAKPKDYDDYITKAQNVGDPDTEQEGLPERRGNKWVWLKNGEVAGEYDLENEQIHLQSTVANPALSKAPRKTGSEAAARGTEPDVEEPIPSAAKSFNKDCKRYDVGVLDKPVEMPNGWLKCDAFLTRTGVFKYRNTDGSDRREYRPPSEVFHPLAMQSFQMVPVTDDHPPVFLNDSNTREFQRGNMGERIVREDYLVRGPMIVNDGKLIRKMKSGDQVQVSCGYTCDLEDRQGVTDDGEHYDCIQRNIRGNHVAIVPVARAGEEAHVRMDSGAWAMVRIEGQRGDSPSFAPEGTVAKKIKIDGKEFVAGSEEAAEALDAQKKRIDSLGAELKKLQAERADDPKDFAEGYLKHLDEVKKLHDSAKKMHDALRATHEVAAQMHDRHDEEMGKEYAETKRLLESQQKHAEEEAARADKAEAELKEAPARAIEAFKARQTLEAAARTVLGRKEKFDGLSDKEVKVKVLAKAEPDLSLKGKPDAYIDARFDIAIEEFKPDEHEDSVVTDTDEDLEPGDPRRFDGMTDEWANKPHADKAEAQAAMEFRHRNMWKQPIAPPESARR